MFWSMSRQGQSPEASRSRVASACSVPAFTSRKLSMTTPSSSIRVLSGGAEPGVLPPMSAWCPREATVATISPSWKSGVTTVTSGRWVPPLKGLFVMKTSPGSICPAFSDKIVFTLSDMEPRCTGTCGALATRSPAPSKIAQEKSSRSLMLTE